MTLTAILLGVAEFALLLGGLLGVVNGHLVREPASVTLGAVFLAFWMVVYL